jgi:short subunit dehydrogenase-like uncharacterized protein
MPNPRPFDLVLFGASGFTGELTAQYLAKSAQHLRWALAGRNLDKLEQVRARLEALAGSAPRPELIAADVDEPSSMRALAASARVVITTVGPYGRYGEPLVAACAELGTDYVDLTGEPEFVARMATRYHAQAAASGAKIVHACGFDSIPHDLGALFTVRALRRRMSPAETETTPITIEGVVRASGTISGGTWQSMLLILSETPAATVLSGPGGGRHACLLPPRIRYRKELGMWAVPLPTIDPLVVCRSAGVLPMYGPDFRYGHYLGLKHAPQVVGLLAGAGALYGLAKWGPSRELLAKWKTSGEGPSEAERAKSFFKIIFSGTAGVHRVRCQVRGGDPGYGETAKMLAESALCLAFDRERLPAHHGVVTSAAAMGEVLIERLQLAGIVFEELSELEA